MEKTKTKMWVVDENYIPPHNSKIVSKEVNTITGEVRYVQETWMLIPEADKRVSFMENLKDYVGLNSNPVMWFCSLIAYVIHFIFPATLWLCIYADEGFRTPGAIAVAIALTFALLIGEIVKGLRFSIISVYSFLIFLTIVVGLFYALVIVPFQSFTNT